jgi:hypothetical protein
MDTNATGANDDPIRGGSRTAEPGTAGRTPVRPSEAIRRLAYMGLNASPSSVDPSEVDALARRYRREAQLAVEGAVWWAISWPFELMSALVNAGRKWEEDYFQPAPRRRVPLEDEDI